MNPAIFVAVIWFKLVSTLDTCPLPTTTCSFLFKISKESPTFKLDLSIGVFKLKVEPDILTWNLELVLYFQELAKICLYVSLLFFIFSPTFFTKISSSSLTNLTSETVTNSERTPVILKSTLFDKLPFS